ncbi:MAG: SIMPL domain-containing protein [Rhodospirillales bacterium]|nr:SIMPL domain-containing protein [Rhodospirillales bacterium]
MKIIKLLIFLCLVLAAMPAQAGERTISVDGHGVTAAKPDTAELRVAVIANETTAAAAMAGVSSKAGAVLETLTAHGIPGKHIQTGSISLNPLYQRNQANQEQQPKVIGYRASIDNRVRVGKLDGLGKIIDALTKAGADRLDSIRFLVADTKPLQAAARASAVKDAIAAAKQLAVAAGIELGEVISISDGANDGPVPQQRMMAFQSAERGVPVMPGEINVQVRVHMVFAIKK